MLCPLFPRGLGRASISRARWGRILPQLLHADPLLHMGEVRVVEKGRDELPHLQREPSLQAPQPVPKPRREATPIYLPRRIADARPREVAPYPDRHVVHLPLI